VTDIESLEKRVKFLEKECRRLSDIEAIRRLRYKYWRCIHHSLWDDLMDCYANDAVVDFEAVLKDPQNPNQMNPAYFINDHLHPNDAGYKLMADSIDLAIFGK